MKESANVANFSTKLANFKQKRPIMANVAKVAKIAKCQEKYPNFKLNFKQKWFNFKHIRPNFKQNYLNCKLKSNIEHLK